MQRLGLELPATPRVISPRGEMLRREARALLEETFGCRVVDQYNCEEIGNMAWDGASNGVTPNTETVDDSR